VTSKVAPHRVAAAFSLASLASFASFGSLAATPAWADGTKQQCIDGDVKAQDLRRDGKLSAAREALRQCAAASCPAAVRDDCSKRLDDLDRAQPTLILAARDAAGNDIVAVTVTMDGQPFADRLPGTPLPVDPGEHTFVFQAPGQPPLEKRLVVRESEQGRREGVTLGGARAAGDTVAGAGGESRGAPRGHGTQKVLALIAAGVGVVGVGVGSAFGLVALSDRNAAQSVCPGQCADSSGVSKWSDAKTAGNVSTVAFVVGGVGLAAGAVLWLTATPAQRPGATARLGLGPGSLHLEGAW
jgi:hypothetical protein